MTYLSRRDTSRNISAAQPDLFSWRPLPSSPTPRAVRKLAQKYGLTIAHATTVARLAGIGAETEAR
jgi:hypothetical protein